MNILKDILLEFGFAGSVSVDDITNAITNLLTAKIKYDDGEGGDGKGERIICPVAYGISTAGIPVIRAFQTVGSSKRGIPQWKLFNVGKIKSWNTIEGQKYSSSELVGFNKDGDRQMEIIYSIAPIGKAKDITISKSKNMPNGLTDGPVTKKNVNDSGKEPEMKQVDNSHYTANDAIDDILTSSGNIPEKNVDNSSNKQYINNKIEAPETKPITNNDVPGGDKPVDSDEYNKENDNTGAVANEPIQKNDVDKTENELTTSFKNMMNRMNSLDKDNEDEKEY